MPRIPDASALGERTIPAGRAPLVQDRSGEILAGALGQSAERIGSAIAAFGERQDQLQYAKARSELLSADAAIRKELENDNDWQTYEQRYREKLGKAREKVSATVRGRSDRALFEQETSFDLERGAASIRDMARRKEVDVGRADLDTVLDANRRTALETPDEALRSSLIGSAQDAIAGAQAKGYISAEEAVNRRQNWVASYGLGYLESQTPAERIRLLTSPKGTAAEYLPPDARQKLLKIAEQQDRQNRIDASAQAILGEYRRSGELGDAAIRELGKSKLSLEDQLSVQSAVRTGLGLLNDERRRQYVGDINSLERAISLKQPPADAEARAERLYRLGAYTPEQYINVLQAIDRANVEGVTERAGMEQVRAALSAGLPLDPKSQPQQQALDAMFKADTAGVELGSPGWQAQASAYAGKTRILPSAATAWARQTMRSPDPKIAAEGAQFFGAVQAASPDAVSEFDPDTKAFAGMINSMIESGTQPAKAAEVARDLVFSAAPAVVKHRKELYENGRDALAKQSDSALDSLIDRDFDTWKTAQPASTASLSEDFKDQVGRYFERTGDINLARELAWTDIKRVYGVSRVNGDAQMMPMAPERFGVTPEIVRAEIADFINGKQVEQPTPAQVLERNSRYAKPAPAGGYLTKLAPADEQKFQQWVKANDVPFDPSPTADYDMRGFWKAKQSGDARASTGVNRNDGKMHFSDAFKTPYHRSFSSESIWATKDAPHWNEQDQLVLPSGEVVFDERAKPSEANPQADGSQPEEITLVPDALTLRSLSNALDGKPVRPSYSLVTKTGDLVLDKNGVPLRYVLPVPDIDGQIRKAKEAAAAEVVKARRVRKLYQQDKEVRDELARQGLDMGVSSSLDTYTPYGVQ